MTDGTPLVLARERAGVRARLLGDLGEMAPAQRRLATYLLEHLAFAGEQTITELADAVGVSLGTISQLCHRLGLKGYAELRLALAREAAVLSSRSNLLDDNLTAGGRPLKPGDAESCLRRVFAANGEALAETARSASISGLDRAAILLTAARRIEWVGVGTAGLVAAEGANKLRRLGFPASSFVDSHIQAMSASLLGAGDVLVVVSHSGRTLDVLACARAAKGHGASVIGITKAGRSPLAELADTVLGTVSYDAAFQIEPMASALAEMSMIQVLFLMLLERGGDSTRDNLLTSQESVESRHLRDRRSRPLSDRDVAEG
jgi:DNA-binding MurR/RpiR family transcriptional regulator